MSEARRKQLEQRIVETGRKIAPSPKDPGWLTSLDLPPFLDAWLDLIGYYRLHADDLVSYVNCEVLSIYLDCTRAANEILRRSKMVDHHEQALEMLRGLEHVLDQIIAEGYGSINEAEDEEAE